MPASSGFIKGRGWYGFGEGRGVQTKQMEMRWRGTLLIFEVTGGAAHDSTKVFLSPSLLFFPPFSLNCYLIWLLSFLILSLQVKPPTSTPVSCSSLSIWIHLHLAHSLYSTKCLCIAIVSICCHLVDPLIRYSQWNQLRRSVSVQRVYGRYVEVFIYFNASS